MAVDHALAACSSPGEAVLRIYRWSCPTVSFGRNEPVRARYDPAAGHSAGIEFVRRPTGGRAVLHDRELTYAVVLPGPKPGDLRATYGLINRGLVEALGSLGVSAVMATGHGVPASRGSAAKRGFDAGPDSGPCFEEPAPGEVTVAGRKLVGSAQARLEGAILQHGSLLIAPGQERLYTLDATCAGVRRGSAEVKAPASLEEVLGRTPPWSDLVQAVISGLSGVTGGEWYRGELTEPERVKTDTLTERYGSAEWTWRR